MDFKLSLQSETIRSVYPEAPVAVEPTMSVADVIVLMQTEKVAAVLVCDDDRLVGVFTERDVLRVLAERVDLSQPIRAEMSADPVTVNDDSTVGAAIGRMAEGGYRHLPIVSSIRPTEATGMVDVRGVMRYLVEHFPSTIYNLSPKSSRTAAEREGA
ncbi:inosine 5'-monophosphate dehydrogenase [Botrimarina colliarenosi]|uniref:Inosine 5'-monophosphate dehydrogenase n=1 Tax=Botrimarina colliarenosi TaxID=2528001 RepID=A0A5C6AIV7_9BACT|nr:CBS domain-containing protein [Botrimarina colliarenosi]TWT99340.1 inosine 5'-monophosphate dehydrogenase [Botrimarina colliarenosi]